jgi:hypothetical protein
MTTHAAPNTLILTSAFYHPETAVRDRLLKVVDQWVDSLEPRYSETQIRGIISNEGGTPLEPFVLDKADVDMAVRMAMAAFSKKVSENRFRIVSRDTIGFKGGLVITNNLKHYYAERYMRGNRRRNPKSGISFFPAYAPSCEEFPMAKLTKSRAIVETDEKGFIIRLSWPYLGIDAGLAARALQRHSRILSSDKPFDQLGLRVDVQPRGVEVRTGSPESQIKMAAHMMNHDVLRLSLGNDYPEAPHAQILLDLPEADSMRLKTVFMTSEKTWLWIQDIPVVPIRISKNDKLAISRWLPPPLSWIDEIWDEL